MKQKKNKYIKIKPVEVKIYIEGKCFICGKECSKESYAHWECALAYAEHKYHKIKQAWAEVEGTEYNGSN